MSNIISSLTTAIVLGLIVAAVSVVIVIAKRRKKNLATTRKAVDTLQMQPSDYEEVAVNCSNACGSKTEGKVEMVKNEAYGGVYFSH